MNVGEESMEQLKAEVADLRRRVADNCRETRALEGKMSESFEAVNCKIDKVDASVGELLSLFKDSKGFVRILRMIGKLVLWVGGLAAAIAGIKTLGHPLR